MTPSIRFIEPKSLAPSASITENTSEDPPPGTMKSIIPCTPLAIVKCLEYVGVYNKILPYGDRAYGKTITVINRYFRLFPIFDFTSIDSSSTRSEVVGRPLAALLSNDGARVLSVDIDSIQVRPVNPLDEVAFTICRSIQNALKWPPIPQGQAFSRDIILVTSFTPVT